MSAARDITLALGGKWKRSGQGDALCPAHKDREPSLTIADGRDGILLLHCFAGCAFEDIVAELRRKDLVNDRQRAEPPPQVDRRKLDRERQDGALAIWAASYPAAHTPAGSYLRERGIMVPIPPTIRYHEPDHALVAAIQGRHRAVVGVQRIFLETDSAGVRHRGKRSLGPIKGGACRLTPVAGTLQICESIEDGLALLQLTNKTTWSVPGTAFLPSIELPPEVREVVLAPDKDKAGLEAIEKAKAALKCRVAVRQLLPPPGLDWCEALELIEERAGIQEFDGGFTREEAENQSWVEVFSNG